MKIGESQEGIAVRVICARIREWRQLCLRCKEHAVELQKEAAEQAGLAQGYLERVQDCEKTLRAMGLDPDEEMTKHEQRRQEVFAEQT